MINYLRRYNCILEIIIAVFCAGVKSYRGNFGAIKADFRQSRSRPTFRAAFSGLSCLGAFCASAPLRSGQKKIAAALFAVSAVVFVEAFKHKAVARKPPLHNDVVPEMRTIADACVSEIFHICSSLLILTYDYMQVWNF